MNELPEIKRPFRFIGPIAGVLLFITAIGVLHHELLAYHYHDIINELKLIPNSSIVLAFLFTLLNFLVLGVYEILGFKYIKNTLAWSKILLTSFIAFSFSNNVGFYSISSSAVRYRLYSQWGLSTFDITKLIAFSSGITFWLGLSAICAFVFIAEPVALPSILHLPFASTHLIGWLFTLPVAGFVIMAIFRKKPVHIRSWEFEIPSIHLTLGLILLACLDWVFFSAVLYNLLPTNTISFPVFLSIFMAAMVVGLASHVPGGLGVFESMFILLLPQVPASTTMGALLVFRGIYYLLPLGLSAISLGLHELSLRKKQVAGIAQIFSQWGSGVVPYFFSVMIFIGGVILLFSGATPGEHQRMHWLTHVMPLPVLEFSHFMASIFGVGLLVLSWGIYQRRDSAYQLTLFMLAGGALFSLFKGLDYEEAIILSTMALALAPGGRQFYRKTSFVNSRFSVRWFAAIAVVIASSIWLGFFAYKHVAYSHELWWQFSFTGTGHASRFLRASVGSVVAFFMFGIFKLLSPVRIKPELPSLVDIDIVRNIVETSVRSSTQLAFLGDKSFLFSEHNDAFIMYGVSGRSWIVMGEPVGNPASFLPLVWQFRELCDRHNGWPVFYEVTADNLSLFLEIGLTLLKLGENGRVDLNAFSLEGSSRKSMRHNKHKIEQDGFTFDIIRGEAIGPLLPALKTVSDEWLADKKTREKRFSLGFFDERYLRENPIALVHKAGTPVAFSNLWLTLTKEEASIDLMRYSKNAPKGVMDFLFSNIILWAKAQGYRWFDLGMAPFSGLDDRKMSPLWNKLGSYLYDHGEEVYNFQGLRQFKEKYDPVWCPKYIAVPGGFSLPLILRDVSSIISGGLKGVFSK